MFCVANMLGLFSCKARLNPSRASFFSRLFSFFFCTCQPKQIIKIDNPNHIEVALKKAKTQYNKEKREKEKQLHKLKRNSALIIQKAYKKYKLILFIEKYVQMHQLAKCITPLISVWRAKRARRTIQRKLNFSRSIRRQNLAHHVFSLIHTAEAIRLGTKTRQEFSNTLTFIIKLQASIRRHAKRSILQDLRWQQREMRAKLYPAMSSPLFTHVAFKKTANLDLMDHVTLVPNDTKIYIKSDLLSFPKGVPHLSQQSFEKNFQNLQHSKGIYFPKVWVIDSFNNHTVPIGLYLVHFKPDHSILPIKFTSIWNGEIIVYVTKLRENRAKKMFDSKRRPLESDTQVPKLDFKLVQQLAIDDKATASKSGLNVLAPSFQMAPKEDTSLRFQPYIVQKKNQQKKKARENYFYLRMPPNVKNPFILPICTLGDYIFLNKSI
uniref:Uncharacterized protein n=1 Tax=Rhizoctonia cerealis hypovirus TaxID=3068667 RepID=A0AA51BSA7_9VIRU|nr:MAG: hypothetical protein [Rhizoctonia cerealis hypovirus]